MTHKSILYTALLFLLTSLGSCKFYFSESEYLGTYPGTLESETGTVISCGGQAILTDVGDNMVNIELATDSNPTYYFNGLHVNRGFSISSHLLRINTDLVDVWIDRNNHSITISHINGSYYDYRFYGNRQ